MGSIDGVTRTSNKMLFRAKATSFETTFRQNLETFKELMQEAERIQLDLEACETELQSQKQKCERKLCCSSEIYEKIVQSKNNIIHLAVSTAIRIDETKNLNMMSDLLKILCGDIEVLTPPKESQDNKENNANLKVSTPSKNKLQRKKSNSPIRKSPVKKKKTTPKKEQDTSLEDVSFKDDSMSEIEGTPGRTSPIIQPKKLKSSSSASLSGTPSDSREKKKCPNSWGTPEAKQMKLLFPSPKRAGKGKALRQSRLNVVACKSATVVDLTCSPELSGGSSSSQNPLGGSQDAMTGQNPHVQILIKKEPSDNDDTILPSPTSGPTNIVLSRTASKDGKVFKKPLSLLKMKSEHVDEVNSPIIQVVDVKSKNITRDTKTESLEESINILKTNRFAKPPHESIKRERSPVDTKPSPKKEPTTFQSPVKLLVKSDPVPMDEDVTHCEESSMSILQHVNKLEQVQKSPNKSPLAENQNIVNVPTEQESVSLLPPVTSNNRATTEDNHKRKVLQNNEPMYKEPTVRKKAEKLALPAWCCDECKAFFGDLYSGDPERIRAVVERCSRHRGRSNPARAATPPGFWYPRWDVPADTEEFNRRNNAD